MRQRFINGPVLGEAMRGRTEFAQAEPQLGSELYRQ